MMTQRNLSTNTVSDQLKAEREKLIAAMGRHTAQAFLKAHAKAVDEYFLAGFSQSAVGPRMGIMRNPYALIALGGYGRGEQCLFSDIDLLFLFDSKVPGEAEALVKEIIYPLWDMGLEVGHATRSIKECLQMAQQDLEVLTSLLDARFICGMSPLYHQLMERLRTKLINPKPDRIIHELIQVNRSRHVKFGDSAYLLEPNLKEGQGGLRDYHTMLWIARIQSDLKTVRDLEYDGYLSHDEYQSMNRALEYVWNMRNHLHLIMGRKCDQLHLEKQVELAQAMQIKNRAGHVPVEILLGHLHSQMEFIKQCYQIFVYELDQKKRLSRKNKALKETRVVGLKFNRGMLNFSSPESIVRNPLLLIHIFMESAVHRAPLSAEARRLIKEFSYLISDETFRRSPIAVNMFEKIMARPMELFDALQCMLETGFLVCFIPEFEAVINRIQFDQYHLYPVGRHLILTVQMLKKLDAGYPDEPDALSIKLFQEIRNKRLLFWSALLHDIGKGEPTAGHSRRGADMVVRILEDKGLEKADIESIEFLVREHLLLFETATRRDINDEETALIVAGKVAKPERLKMLYLLSVADAMATGPKAWNQWTASLMRSLFLKVLNSMQRGELVSRRAIRVMDEKKEHILVACTTEQERQATARLLTFMSPRYLLNTPLPEIPQHIELFRRLEERSFVWRIDRSADGHRRTITLCAKDRPGLLSKIAGVLTLNSINILDVRIFTWRNNVALDIFEVQAPPDLIFEDDYWKRTEKRLEAALTGRLDIGAELDEKFNGYKPIRSMAAMRPQRVIIDNETSSFFTIIEVIAWDFPGLLYRVTDALFRCGLDIWVAKIATRVDQVIDVFYVRNFDGEKVDRPVEESAIRETITAVLEQA